MSASTRLPAASALHNAIQLLSNLLNAFSAQLDLNILCLLLRTGPPRK